MQLQYTEHRHGLSLRPLLGAGGDLVPLTLHQVTVGHRPLVRHQAHGRQKVVVGLGKGVPPAGELVLLLLMVVLILLVLLAQLVLVHQAAGLG